MTFGVLKNGFCFGELIGEAIRSSRLGTTLGDHACFNIPMERDGSCMECVFLFSHLMIFLFCLFDYREQLDILFEYNTNSPNLQRGPYIQYYMSPDFSEMYDQGGLYEAQQSRGAVNLP